MSQTRRNFLASTATIAAASLIQNPLLAFQPVIHTNGANPPDAWWLKVRRMAQHNLNEYDPKILDINKWVDYWAGLELDAIILTAGGFMAMYPTKLPNHYKSQFLGDRDLFGDYLKAFKKKNIRVIARLETNFLHQDIYKNRPEWFELDKDGNPVKHSETPWVYRTCLFSNYRNEQMPKIIQEVISMYDIDGFFTNSWPEVEHAPHLCYCQSCKKLGDLSHKQVLETAMDRNVQTINLINTESRKKPGCIYDVNIAGGIGAIQDLKTVANLSDLITTDHQGRGGNTAIWDCSQQGKVAYAAMRGKPVTNVIGVKTGAWRHSSNTSDETTLWMAQTTSSGMIPWLVWLGSDLPDNRWQEIGTKYYRWLKKNEIHFTNKRSMAKVAVVFSQRLNELYTAPGKVPGGYGGEPVNPKDKGNPLDYLQGMYYALLEGRFVFDFIHEDDLTTDIINNYSGLIMPNTALLSDAQVANLQKYVNAGGSILATFETGLYDEWGTKRSTFALSEIFNTQLKPGYTKPLGGIFYASTDGNHEITKQFKGLQHIPGGEFYIPVKTGEKHVLDIVPPYPNGIPEMVYGYPRKEINSANQVTDNPALITKEKGNSRAVYFPTDIDKLIWTSVSADLSSLMQEAIRWMLHGKFPVKVQGEGYVEIFAWETEPGFAIHVLNYNNPNMTKGAIRKIYPIGEQKVTVELPAGVTIKKASLLRADKNLIFKQTGNMIEFTIPSVQDVEIAALYKS